jgi:transcriptional antiterminator
MTRRTIRNKIDKLEQSANSENRGIYILDEQPDGTYRDSNGERIKIEEIPDNAVVIFY